MSDEEDTDSNGTLSNATLIELVYKQGLNAAQWREIGTQLKVKSSTLDEIEWAHHRSPKGMFAGGARCVEETVRRCCNTGEVRKSPEVSSRNNI